MPVPGSGERDFDAMVVKRLGEKLVSLRKDEGIVYRLTASGAHLHLPFMCTT